MSEPLTKEMKDIDKHKHFAEANFYVLYKSNEPKGYVSVMGEIVNNIILARRYTRDLAVNDFNSLRVDKRVNYKIMPVMAIFKVG